MEISPTFMAALLYLGAGLGMLLVNIVRTLRNTAITIVYALLLGFVAYGLSIHFYISAQRELGAARTCAYYAAAPFIGVILSWVILQEMVSGSFLMALVIILVGSYLAITETHCHIHAHLGAIHEHRHNHSDSHHNHVHQHERSSDHSHEHDHERLTHDHEHLPDSHHKHTHLISNPPGCLLKAEQIVVNNPVPLTI